MKPSKLAGIQYAALPYRIEGRQVQVLLITLRGTQRWVIPKGWPHDGLNPCMGAAAEAAEEAGVVGEIDPRPIGSYSYQKRLKSGRAQSLQVIVFPLRVDSLGVGFKEEGQRTARWFSYQQAAARVAEPSLARLIRAFGDARSANPLMRGLRRYWTWRFGAAWDEGSLIGSSRSS
jgi:8-oxo-dGTP pyrophosphatase MutT (NUDIX family)